MTIEGRTEVERETMIVTDMMMEETTDEVDQEDLAEAVTQEMMMTRIETGGEIMTDVVTDVIMEDTGEAQAAAVETERDRGETGTEATEAQVDPMTQADQVAVETQMVTETGDVVLTERRQESGSPDV